MISFNWINTPYPFEHSATDKWKTILTLTIFLILILMLEPYGFDLSTRLHLLADYLLVCILPLTINYFGIPILFPKYFKNENWSIRRAFLFLIYNFIIIGFWNHIHSALFVKNNLPFLASGIEITNSLLKMVGIGGIASCLLILFRYNVLARHYLELSQTLNHQLQGQLKIKNESKDIHIIEVLLEGRLIPFDRSDLLFVRSDGNYLRFYLRSKLKSTPQLYRGRMKELEDALRPYPEFFRCHRSYLINLNFVETAHGNSQGLNISLINHEERLPVARPKIKDLNTRIANLKTMPFIT